MVLDEQVFCGGGDEDRLWLSQESLRGGVTQDSEMLYFLASIIRNRKLFLSRSIRSKSNHQASTLIHPTLLDHQSLSDSQQAQSSARAHIDHLLTHPRQFKDSLLPFASLSFSTSGGKGGQNVNKVNTKATLRLELRKLKSIIPAYWITNLSNSHLYAPQTGQLVIQSSLTRSQASNCFSSWFGGKK
ncbi:hypothetical protein VP01_573g1 [Puccinia sorghi]|uniref:Prokaryotic-type class I peptide chain release factors domain-containing protein n=1 Tax=Puccinia sorghi TaxID=27349 RepID=A0A0L6UIJ0_9BASI|nr:hypothetical protein VP01_573g1 [Puccinia sorghi]